MVSLSDSLPTSAHASSDAGASGATFEADSQRSAIPNILSIAGTDPTGGAGIQADLKSISAAGGYGMCVVTALVAQNTHGVRSIHVPPQDFLKEQLDAVFDDVEVDAVKIGMLGDVETTETVSNYLAAHPAPTVVVDPVMVATNGDRLLTEDAEEAMRQFVKDHASVVTPNIPELAVLAGTQPAETFDAALEQGREYAKAAGVKVLVKGGHLKEGYASNALVTPEGEVDVAQVPRVDTKNTHGTGCSLSSALATRMSIDPDGALAWTSSWLHEAIAHADDLNVGTGHGPVDHFHRSRRLTAAASTQPWKLIDDWTAPSSPSLEPKIPAAGPFTRELWDKAAKKVWPETLNSPFIRALRDGTLPEEQFGFYLVQDAYYLREYSRALATVGAKAPEAEDQVWWTQSATVAIEAESDLHRNWISQHHVEADTPPSPVTLGYVNMLTSTVAFSDYIVGAAAVLPCFWLYAEVGLHLAENNHPEHPYNAWLSMYGGDDFTDAVRMALNSVEKALSEASEKQRAEAIEAFMHACYYEREFFDQATRN